MKDLRLTVDTNDGVAEFSFVRIYTVKGVVFFISVKRQGAFGYFHMEERDGKWRIVKGA